MDAFAISLSPAMDLAEGWDCKNGAECENRAYSCELFPTEIEARQGVGDYALKRYGGAFPNWHPAHAYRELHRLDGLERVHILHVTGLLEACYDYREIGCQIEGAVEQLQSGEGEGEAWSVVRRNRAHFGAYATRLPGKTPEGHLFAFLSGCRRLRMNSVAKVPCPNPEDLPA